MTQYKTIAHQNFYVFTDSIPKTLEMNCSVHSMDETNCEVTYILCCSQPKPLPTPNIPLQKKRKRKEKYTRGLEKGRQISYAIEHKGVAWNMDKLFRHYNGEIVIT